jgi:hypothetical protein
VRLNDGEVCTHDRTPKRKGAQVVVVVVVVVAAGGRGHGISLDSGR